MDCLDPLGSSDLPPTGDCLHGNLSCLGDF
ncbi:hypothetical protein BRC2024_HCTLARHO_CDS_0018 [Acinetobacter phage vB_AbaS_Silvergun]